jgi:hypothetical protein
MSNEVKSLIDKWIQKKSTGNITINFFKGGITSWKVEETFKPLKLESINYDIKEIKKSSGKY